MANLQQMTNKLVGWLVALVILTGVPGMFVYLNRIETAGSSGRAELSKNLAIITQRLDDIDIKSLEAKTLVALNVVDQHGEELKMLNERILLGEQRIEQLRSDMTISTSDRFTGDDGKNLRERIEEWLRQREKIVDLQFEAIKKEIHSDG